MQPHESYTRTCPVFLVESYIFTVSRFKALVQLLKPSHIIFKSKIHSFVSYCYWNCFFSMSHKVVSFLQSSFAKMLPCYCSPCYQLFLCAYVFLRMHHVLLTCRHIALSFVRNQYSRHDFKVHVSTLFTFLSAVLPYFPLLNGCTWCNMYCIVYKSVVLLTKRFGSFVLSKVSPLYFAASGSLRILLQYCNEQAVLSSNLWGHEHLLIPIGGGRQHLFSNSSILPFIKQGGDHLTPNHVYRYVDHMDDTGRLAYPLEQGFVYANLTLANIVPFLSRQMVQKIARIHKIPISTHWNLTKEDLAKMFEGHHCINCTLYMCVLEPRLSPSLIKKEASAKAFADLTEEERAKRNKTKRASRQNKTKPKEEDQQNKTKTKEENQQNKIKHKKENGQNKNCKIKNEKENKPKENHPAKPVQGPPAFPPPPLTKELGETIIRQWCKETEPSVLEESGCAVCGELVPISRLSRLKAVKKMLGILVAPGVTRIERKSAAYKISEFKGPVLDYRCDKICDNCRKNIRKGKIPRLALANNLWLGEVPKVLHDLNYVERLLVARIRHNCCFVKVASSGLKKMTAHVIAFESPLPKVYHILPPPVEDMDDILAILFTGPSKPTEEDLSRLPLLVRRNHVGKALEWLKLNHVDYNDLEISYDNLKRYPEDTPPVSVEYRCEDSNKVPEGTSTFDNEVDDGVATGECPFIVHGLTGVQLETKTIDAQKAIALQHWSNKGKALAIGRSPHAESIYDNPGLYPQLFPWLFPYGHGGIGSALLSHKEHKRHLLMYHDKHFQQDPAFPFVAFSHEQIKASTTGGFLLAETNKFDDIASRLLRVNQEVLSSIADRMSKGELVKPSNQEETDCFQVIRDLDHIGGKVSGSVTSKKYMRNEIWSLIAQEGAPLWYITLSPADIKNPIALYYADQDVTFKPRIRATEERYRLIASNPVACARFFNFMIEQFIKHVLGVGSDHPGLYGETSAYYGTVEQQGRLTLHIHLLLWIKGCLTPDEIRDRIIDPTSDFQKQLVKYLENAHQGEFLTGTQTDVLYNVSQDAQSTANTYTDPTETLPEPPPAPCTTYLKNLSCDGNCRKCQKLNTWRETFARKVDDVISKSNIHTCSTNINRNGTQNKAKSYKGCLDNKWGRCKSRFPRDTFAETRVDPVTGALDLKKKEPWINFFSPVVSYLFRCNTDVTSLRSGTAIKGTLLYISDYITKMTLKTHVAFESIRSVFQKNSEMLGGCESQHVKARKLMTKMVNTMSAKLELGSPMICLYLLGNPDHYTSHRFVPFYWLSFVQEVRKAWDEDLTGEPPQKIGMLKRNGRIVGISYVHDYIHRPKELDDVSLYDWISTYKREKLSNKNKRKALPSSSLDDEAVEESLCEDDAIQDEPADLGDGSEDSDDDSEEGGPNKFPEHAKVTTVAGKGMLHFTTDHPLFATHGLKRLPSPLVPNFVGQTLPRRDQSDREFYCTTMLTLFKPWRTGTSLKAKEVSWDEAFTAHTFSERQEQIMKNFNIRYECLDQRDDFFSELKKGGTAGPALINNDVDVDEINQSGVLDDISVGDMVPDDIDIDNQESQRYRQQMKTMSVTKHIMTKLGWTACKPNTFQVTGAHEPVSGIRLGTEWKEVVALKRRDILDSRMQSFQVSRPGAVSSSSDPLYQGVKIVDKDYLEKKCVSLEWEAEMDSVQRMFNLNADQERAFRIVANHSCHPTSEKLKMHIGGMGGTGKSQVLKALMELFCRKKESHRFIIVAPTGSAAALLGGSTYHYMFGINDFASMKSANSQLAEVKQRLQGVDYIFMDEVSMLSCKDIYRISEKLAKVMNNTEEPFGGLNMIFAGDFAQLPPAIGQEHASLYSRTVGSNPRSLHDQEAAIGKALWHQITTVVILRENMRQKTQTPDDERLREALSNMRYKACTPDDIAFLRSRISSEIEGRPSVSDQRFRNVSVITTLNLPKDVINDLGSQRFAMETGQELVNFYSEDTVNSSDSQEKRSVKKNNVRRKKIQVPLLSPALQQIVWDLPPSSNTKNIPGKLSLCRGLPVIIRLNSATELCMTKGQEAIVYDWQATTGSKGQCMLDTLFVKLINPPQTVKLDDLPENVVPLIRTATNTQCLLPNDATVNISRSQVEILPNFAITDYTSQGKTRINNPTDLSSARSHQSYYTALSRSASAAGTVILQGFDTYKITGGASGALRQEFREIEMLDDITTLRYNGKLSSSVVGVCRNDLISAFRRVKGEKYIPSKVHRAIRWKESDPFHLSEGTNIPWKIVDSNKPNPAGTSKKHTIFHVVPLDQIHSAPLLGKRKLEDYETEANETASKKFRMTSEATKELCIRNDPSKATSNPTELSEYRAPIDNPRGLQWSNNSCAFDAVLSVLYNIWQDNPAVRTLQFKVINNEYLGKIVDGFLQVRVRTEYTLEEVRDSMRRSLQRADPVVFPWGGYTGIQYILDYLLRTSHSVTSSLMRCPNNHLLNRAHVAASGSQIPILRQCTDIQAFIDDHSVECASRCHVCHSHVIRQHVFEDTPAIIAFDLSQHPVTLLESIVITTVDGACTTYKLRGIMYYLDNHFTSRFVSESGCVWYHDGIATGSQMVLEGTSVGDTELGTCRSGIAVCAVYVVISC